MNTDTTFVQKSIATITRMYPLYSGAASFANHRSFQRLTGTNGRAWAPTAGGEVMADLSDFVGRAAFFIGDLDPKISWVARRILRPGDIAFDVGANIGILTLLFSNLVGPRGQVHAFEPNPEVAKNLGLAVEKLPVSNVTINRTAVGSVPGNLSLKVPKGNRGGGSLLLGDAWSDYDQHDVTVTTLDDYVANNLIGKIDFLKIDIEGFELELFKGANNVLDNIAPRAIVFEDNARLEGESELIGYLKSRDYNILGLPKAKFRMRATALDSASPHDIHDFVAAKKGRLFDDLRSALT